MKTFSEELKQHWIDQMQAHQEADRLIQGEWLNTDAEFYEGEEFHRGCFFGCAMQTDSDALQEAIEHMQLPPWLVHLSEKIFEGLPKDDALAFPVQLLKAIPSDTDISEVIHKIAVKRLEPLIRESNGAESNEAIQQVIDYHKNTERTEEDRKAADSAATSIADSAADSAARSAAYSADSAAYSAAYSAVHLARSAVWQKERDNLLQALRSNSK